MTAVDVIDLDLSLRMSKVKFLKKRVVLVYILCSLDLDVQLPTIHGIGDCVANMF